MSVMRELVNFHEHKAMRGEKERERKKKGIVSTQKVKKSTNDKKQIKMNQKKVMLRKGKVSVMWRRTA